MFEYDKEIQREDNMAERIPVYDFASFLSLIVNKIVDFIRMIHYRLSRRDKYSGYVLRSFRVLENVHLVYLVCVSIDTEWS